MIINIIYLVVVWCVVIAVVAVARSPLLVCRSAVQPRFHVSQCMRVFGPTIVGEASGATRNA